MENQISNIHFHLPEDNTISPAILSNIFDKTVATYKFYWFLSILDNIKRTDKSIFSFWELVAGMIAHAWYPVHYFKLSFGKSDSLYTQIIAIQELLAIPIDAPKDAVRDTILANLDRPEVKKTLRVFTQNVPYWFLTPWLHCKTVSEVIESSQSMMGFCPYSIHGDTICIEEQWRRYLLKNIAILTDFTYWNLAAFVQKRNPNVPDVAAKLIKPISRNSLNKQHKYWDRYFDVCGTLNCIYTDNTLTKENYDLDHFIPWSFCVHDQLWNLIPASGSINSSKSNNLPSLDQYLNPLAAIQHEALKVNFSNNPNDNLLEDYLIFRCSIQELVDMDERTFASTLNKEFTPMMQTASNMGFLPWIR